MPTKKKMIKGNTVKEVATEMSVDGIVNSTKPPVKSGIRRIPWKHIILLVILIAGLLLWKFKSAFVVAVVNGQPISRWQLESDLVNKFGSQELDNLINERLILAAARQKGVFVTNNEIDDRIKQVETRLNGQISLADALKAQGMTMDDFKKQIEIQISIDRLFDNEATISAKEIDDYVASNEAAYKDATDPAQVKQDAQTALKQQKVADLFNTWFSNVRKNAQIQKFL
ncbi:SurA N-terminal domain-containing protein [Patescibacteria group bacterium]|nr:SurA N-terminal domain-containing protein [Patescibacteria group bacterium]